MLLIRGAQQLLRKVFCVPRDLCAQLAVRLLLAPRRVLLTVAVSQRVQLLRLLCASFLQCLLRAAQLYGVRASLCHLACELRVRCGLAPCRFRRVQLLRLLCASFLQCFLRVAQLYGVRASLCHLACKFRVRRGLAPCRFRRVQFLRLHVGKGFLRLRQVKESLHSSRAPPLCRP